MCHKYLKDARLFSLLDDIDQELVQKTQEAKCPICGRRLDVSNFPRKPRCRLFKLTNRFSLRYSLSCSREGRRRRVTPPSVRFLDRKVYLGVVVVLITALSQGATPSGLKNLKRTLGVDRRTLKRWQKWWKETFPKSEFWQQASRQLFPNSPSSSSLPNSLLEVFDIESSLDNFIKFLRFISPITAKFSVSLHASLWPT